MNQLIEYIVWGAIAVGILLFLSILIRFIQERKRRKSYERLMQTTQIRDVDEMDGYVFEDFLANVFEDLGYEAVATQRSNDFGADVMLQHDEGKIVIQAKRYQDKVGLKAVQEIYAAQAFYEANEAWVITNNYYTQAAKQLATACHVTLMNREDLIDLLKERKKVMKSSRRAS